jgi:hypothetical protein
MLKALSLFSFAILAWPQAQRYDAPRLREKPQVDGKLNDSVWAPLPWTTDFVDIEGAKKPKPRFRTRAKMAWDDECLYIAAEMEEPHLWATYDRHDMVIFHEHDFEVFLDPDGDALHYFEFEINAKNTSWDLYLPKPYNQGGKADDAWEIPGLRTAVALRGTLNDPRDRDRGWSVEIAFPWAAFDRGPRPPLPPKAGETWRINFSRVEWTMDIVNGAYRKRLGTNGKPLPEDNWVWSPQGVVNMHVPAQWGHVTFRD